MGTSSQRSKSPLLFYLLCYVKLTGNRKPRECKVAFEDARFVLLNIFVGFFPAMN